MHPPLSPTHLRVVVVRLGGTRITHHQEVDATLLPHAQTRVCVIHAPMDREEEEEEEEEEKE